MKEITKMVQNVHSKEAFIDFVGALSRNFKDDPNSWENKTLDYYFESMQSWIEDMDGYYMNKNMPEPQNVNWQVFAEILIAAKMYE